MNNYTIFHLHSDLSNSFTTLDSVTKFEMYVDKAKEMGMSALAFSEHGNMLHWVKKKKYIESKGMKYIHAVESYVTESLDEKVRDNFHCVLIAKNLDGVKELNKMHSYSTAFNREDGHFFFQPRITFEELLSTSDNIIITTACLGGILWRDNPLKDRFIKFLSDNRHRCFLEIQHHNVEDQIKYNQQLYELHKKYDIPLIAGTDTHSLDENYAEGREILQKAKNIHFDSEDGWDLTMKSYYELIELYKKQSSISEEEFVKAIENTNVMADMVDSFELDYSHKYPKLYEDSESVFIEKLRDGMKNKIPESLKIDSTYKNRANYEFKVMKDNGSIDYMLLEEKIKSDMRKEGIFAGYSRGSCSGSLCAYLLGITDIDSIKFDMNFERFMNPERVSLADIDSDWSPKERGRVKEYIHNMPKLYTSEIVTFNTIALRGAIRDVGRALNMELSEVDYIAKNAEDNEDDFREKYAKLFKYVDLLQGVITSIGSHPAATIVSPLPLDEEMGTLSLKSNSYPISQLNMKEVDMLNFVKLDVLGLDNVGVINDTCKLAGIDRLVPDNMDFDDNEVWYNIIKSPVGIFQFEGTFAHKYLSMLLDKYKEIKDKVGDISRVDLMSLANGAIRPAGDSYRDSLASGSVRDNGNDGLNAMMSNTVGYLIYQEQILEFLHRFCGYSMGKADIIRRAFAKKEVYKDDDGVEHAVMEKYIPEIKHGFIKTMTEEYAMSKEKAENDIEAFLKVIEDASRYLFSKNHSDPYTFIGFATAYLRTYYPHEFIATLLTYNEDKREKSAKVIQYAKEIAGIEIRPAKFRYSSADYTIDKKLNVIYKGVASIKDLNQNVAEKLYSLRNNEYNSFLLALPDILDTGIKKNQIEILIRLGYFSEFGKSEKLYKIYKMFTNIGKAKVISKGKYDEYTESIIEKHSRQTTKQFRDIDSMAVMLEIIMGIEDKDFSISDTIKHELEYLGYVNYVNKDIDKKYCFVLSKTQKGKHPVFEIYRINDGEKFSAKVKITTYNKNKMDSGNIISVPDGAISMEGRWKTSPEHVTDRNKKGFYQDKDDKEPILKYYKVVK